MSTKTSSTTDFHRLFDQQEALAAEIDQLKQQRHDKQHEIERVKRQIKEENSRREIMIREKEQAIQQNKELRDNTASLRQELQLWQSKHKDILRHQQQQSQQQQQTIISKRKYLETFLQQTQNAHAKTRRLVLHAQSLGMEPLPSYALAVAHDQDISQWNSLMTILPKPTELADDPNVWDIENNNTELQQALQAYNREHQALLTRQQEIHALRQQVNTLTSQDQEHKAKQQKLQTSLQRANEQNNQIRNKMDQLAQAAQRQERYADDLRNAIARLQRSPATNPYAQVASMTPTATTHVRPENPTMRSRRGTVRRDRQFGSSLPIAGALDDDDDQGNDTLEYVAFRK